jgi:dTDP-4-dehydrorhamnose reductase
MGVLTEEIMRFAVLGASGQLGRDLCARLPGEVVALTREQVDLTSPTSLRAALEQMAPKVVINCAAYNFVDRAESEPEVCFAVNTWGVRELALLCAEKGWVLVHFSSDHVFGLDRQRRTPWLETDPPGPVSVYGLSKLSGEYLVRALCPHHFVIRTCGLYGVWGSGGKGGNFIETMLRLAGQGKPVRVVHDQRCTPSYTADVASLIAPLVQTGKPGLYHLTNTGDCSWYELACTIFALEGLRTEVIPITTEEFGAPARRPGYSVLAPEGLRGLGFAPLRPWQEALESYLRERRSPEKEAKSNHG